MDSYTLLNNILAMLFCAPLLLRLRATALSALSPLVTPLITNELENVMKLSYLDFEFGEN